jgi:hypothetical protein
MVFDIPDEDRPVSMARGCQIPPIQGHSHTMNVVKMIKIRRKVAIIPVQAIIGILVEHNHAHLVTDGNRVVRDLADSRDAVFIGVA